MTAPADPKRFVGTLTFEVTIPVTASGMDLVDAADAIILQAVQKAVTMIRDALAQAESGNDEYVDIDIQELQLEPEGLYDGHDPRDIENNHRLTRLHTRTFSADEIEELWVQPLFREYAEKRKRDNTQDG